MNKLCLIPLILCLFLDAPSCKKSQVEPMTTMEEKVEKEPQPSRVAKSEEAKLRIVESSGNAIGIDLTNDVPVRGLQFTIEGIKITDVSITSRTKGFVAECNEENGRVILVSFSGKTIAPGTGIVAEIICDKGSSASLSEIKIGN